MKEKYDEIYEKFNQKFIPIEDRKKYLQEMASKLITQSYKYKSEMSEEVQF